MSFSEGYHVKVGAPANAGTGASIRHTCLLRFVPVLVFPSSNVGRRGASEHTAVSRHSGPGEPPPTPPGITCVCVCVCGCMCVCGCVCVNMNTCRTLSSHDCTYMHRYTHTDVDAWVLTYNRRRRHTQSCASPYPLSSALLRLSLSSPLSPSFFLRAGRGCFLGSSR